MTTHTDTDGPDFSQGDAVLINDGTHDGVVGIVTGYDQDHNVYLVDIAQQDIRHIVPRLMSLIEDEEDTILDLPDEIELSDRVIIKRGPWKGQAGVVIAEDYNNTARFDRRMFVIGTEGHELLSIAAESLFRSPYQNERDLDATR